MNRFTVLIVTSVLFGACSNIPVQSKDPASRLPANQVSARDLLGSNPEKTYSSYVSLMKDAEYFNPKQFTRLRTNWERELEPAHARFLSARTSNDVFYALLSMLRSARDLHARLDMPDEFKLDYRVVGLPIKFRPAKIHGQWKFVVVESEDPLVKPGDQLDMYDGKSYPQFESEAREWLKGSSPDYLPEFTSRWLWYRESWELPAPQANDEITIRFYRPQENRLFDQKLRWSRRNQISDSACNKESEIAADYAGHDAVFKGLKYCVYEFPHDVAVVRYFSFEYGRDSHEELTEALKQTSYKSLPPEFKADRSDDLLRADQKFLIDWLKRRAPKTILMDLRENDGGNLQYVLPLAFARAPLKTTNTQVYFSPYLRSHPDELRNILGPDMGFKQVIEDFANSPNAEFSRKLPFYCTSPNCQTDESILKPTGELSSTQLWLLTGPRCLSSCDQIATILKENGIAKVIGMPTNGSSSPFRVHPEFTLANGMKFHLTLATSLNFGPRGHSIETGALRPDVVLEPTTANLKNYLSTVLQRID